MIRKYPRFKPISPFFLSYKLDLSDVKIHIPVATMTQEMFVRFNSEISSKPALYQLRRSQIVPHVITSGSSFYFNDNLFVSSEQPERFGLCFITATSFHGDYQ